jgi:acetyltransferase
VQLALATQQNATHRAEVQKVMVHTRHRRQGIGQALMAAVEESAGAAGRTLLVLDTRRGDISESLYLKVGYKRAGVIPGYARSASGMLDDTVIYYRLLSTAQR